MKVNGIGSSTPVRQSGKTAKAGGSGAFARELDDTAESSSESHAVEAPTSVSGVEALLLAQSVDDATGESRRRMIWRGEDLLDRLDEIRHGLLLGSIPKDRLVALAQMVRARRDGISDPRLTGILDEIELRAEVELAKLARR